MGHPLDFTCALITGAGGGIGRGLAEYFVSLHKKVIITGRHEANVRDTASSLSSSGGDVSYYILDVTDIAAIQTFVKQLTHDHPEVDCLVNAAGVQRVLDVESMAPEDFLERLDNEIDTNIKGPIHLTVHLLPHLRTKKMATIINFASVFGYIPTSVINPGYSASKAYVRFWTMTLREQLRLSSHAKQINVIELAPPTVATDIHREREDPDDNKPPKNPEALTIEAFINDVMASIKAGNDTVGAGPSKAVVRRWWAEFGSDYSDSVDAGSSQLRSLRQHKA